VTEPSYRCLRTISPDTPGSLSAEPPNQCGTLAAGPPLHLSRVPTFTFEIVVVPVTVMEPETALLPEPQPARVKPITASNASAGIAFIRSSSVCSMYKFRVFDLDAVQAHRPLVMDRSDVLRTAVGASPRSDRRDEAGA
jgi:hypothetical protein